MWRNVLFLISTGKTSKRAIERNMLIKWIILLQLNNNVTVMKNNHNINNKNKHNSDLHNFDTEYSNTIYGNKLGREKQVRNKISKSIHTLCDFTQWEQYNLSSSIESITKMFKKMFWTFHSAYGSTFLVIQG